MQNMELRGHKALFYYSCIEIEPLVLVALNVEVVEAHQRASCRKGCWVGNDLAVIDRVERIGQCSGGCSKLGEKSCV